MGITFLKVIFIVVILPSGTAFNTGLFTYPTPTLDSTVFPGEIASHYSVS